MIPYLYSVIDTIRMILGVITLLGGSLILVTLVFDYCSEMNRQNGVNFKPFKNLLTPYLICLWLFILIPANLTSNYYRELAEKNLELIKENGKLQTIIFKYEIQKELEEIK